MTDAEDQLRFAGHTLPELMAKAGRSPAYIYDSGIVEERVATLRRVMPDELRIHYSLKANPMPALVSRISGLVDGFDVASAGELNVALAHSSPTIETSFSGPGKRDSELRASIESGVAIHLESSNELKRVFDIAERLGVTPRLWVRINPDFVIKRSGMIMGGGSQPFGVDAEAVPALIRQMTDLGLSCEGLHCYAGSQMLSADILADVQSRTLDLMKRLVDETRLGRIAMNLGGGLGIPYTCRDKALDVELLGAALAVAIDDIRRDIDVAHFSLELGRFLVGPAGIYVTQIVDRKISRGKRYLVVDGGLHHHLAATGNLGQAIRRNYPLFASRPPGEHPPETVTIVGPLCTPLDILADACELPRLDVGDYVALRQSGAYGFSASPQGFLSHPPPLELLL